MHIQYQGGHLFIDLHIGFYSGSSILVVTSYVLFDLWLPQTATYWMISSDCLTIGYNDCHNGTATKPPKRKHPSYKTSPIKNVPRQNIPATKLSNYKTSQLQNIPSLKMSQLQNILNSKNPKPQNDPSLKKSQLQIVPSTKLPGYKTSEALKCVQLKEKKQLWFNNLHILLVFVNSTLIFHFLNVNLTQKAQQWRLRRLESYFWRASYPQKKNFSSLKFSV